MESVETELPVSEELIVVALGASAGGLEAITALLRNSEPNGHLAFVIAQHMAPQHRSLLVELLSKSCDYDVVGAEDGAEIKPDTVYVNTPNTDISVIEGKIHLAVPADDIGAKPSIDKLFKSVADNYGSRAIAVVLSGTGSDGTQGCRAVRDTGGIVIAQRPDSAKYDGMPNSAIRAGWVDLTMAPDEIARYLAGSHERPVQISSDSDKDDHESVVSVDTLIDRILTQTGIDFRQYKRATLERQLQRRISALRMSSVDDYFSYIDSHPDEVDLVQRSFLISVTEFFRDKEAFEALGSALDTIIEQSRQTKSIRVWVPACATGEEVYSIAIMLVERLGPTLKGYEVKIFATDINELSLEIARQGAYPDSVVEHLPPEMLSTYFDQDGVKYKVKKWVRDLCMFARHDLVKDPSFLRMNLVSCRNLMIYLNNNLQDQLINNFHYALNTGGYLLLGKSESIGGIGDKLFDSVDKTNKLFRRKSGVVSFGRFGSVLSAGRVNVDSPSAGKLISPAHRMNEKVFTALVESYAPPSIQLNDQFQPVQYFGDISPYLKINPGKANFDIVSLSHPQIQTEIRALINRVARGDQDKIEHIVRFRYPGSELTTTVTVSVRRIIDTVTDNHAFVMSFEPMVESTVVTTVSDSDAPADPAAVEELEEELQRTRDHLQAVVEELETSNEELQALNEELQASTEELQASNEELETTNEELQATNEELTTVNDELQAKSILLTDTNETLVNIQRSLDMGLVVVDTDHRVTRFTPQAVRLFGILPDDIGHRLTKLPRHIDVPDFESLLDDVISSGVAVRRELERKGEKYLMNISPYRRDQGLISGAVLTFTETTKLSETIDRAELMHEMLESVGRSINESVMIISPGFTEILFVGERLEELTMRHADVLLRDSQTYLDVVAHADQEMVAKTYKALDSEGWDITYSLKRRDGSTVKVRDVAKRARLEASDRDVLTVVLSTVE